MAIRADAIAAILTFTLSGCAGGSGGTPLQSPHNTLGGTVTGLSGTLVLTDNDVDTLTVTGNGAFQLATAIAPGAAYRVAIKDQPSHQLCWLSGASGIAAGSVTSVAVTCETERESLTCIVDGLGCGLGIATIAASATPPSPATLRIYADWSAGLPLIPVDSPHRTFTTPGHILDRLSDSTQISTADSGGLPGETQWWVVVTLFGQFHIPSGSLSSTGAGGVTGDVTDLVGFSQDQQWNPVGPPYAVTPVAQIFSVVGVHVDAAALMAADAAGDGSTFWRLIANGAPDIVGVAAGSGSAVLYCSAGSAGPSITLTATPQSIRAFLLAC